MVQSLQIFPQILKPPIMEKNLAYKSQEDTELGDVSPMVDAAAERSYGR